MLSTATHSNRSQHIALLLLTACFFFGQISVSILSILFPLAFIFALFSNHWHAQFMQIKANKAALSFWLLGALFLVGILYSTSTYRPLLKDIFKHNWLYITPIFIILITDEQWRQRMINAFLIAMIMTLLLSMFKWTFRFDYHTIIPLIKIGTISRASVFYTHIVQSFAMGIAAFICAYRALFEKEKRALYAIIFIMMAINILIMSGSKTGYLTFLLLLMYLGVIRFGWKSIFYSSFLAIFILVGAYFISPALQDRAHRMVFAYQHYDQIHKQTSTGQRIQMYRIAARMIRARPWFGYGTGGIRTSMLTMIPVKDRTMNLYISYVESIYLNFLLEFGVVGLLIFFIAIGVQIKATFQLPHFYRCLMQVVLISVLFGGLFNMFFLSFPITHMYALFAALCFSTLRPYEFSSTIQTN